MNVYVNAREWFTCTSRCSNHTVTCLVITVTWTADGCSRSLDSRFMRSERTVTEKRFINGFSVILREDAHLY